MSTIPQNFIFRLSFSCKRLDAVPEEIVPETLSDAYRIPYGAYQPWGGGGFLSGHRETRSKFVEKAIRQESASKQVSAEKASKPSFDFRIGWHPEGVLFTVLLSGKKKPVFCDPSKLEISDGLHLVLDTRDVHDIQRGTRYSHRFLFFPSSTDSKLTEPKVFWLPIHRAKGQPNPIDTGRFRMASEVRVDGWSLSTFIPGALLTGYDTNEHDRLAFHFTLQDNELGHFVLQHLPIFPVEEIPSLWSSLILTPASN